MSKEDPSMKVGSDEEPYTSSTSNYGTPIDTSNYSSSSGFSFKKDPNKLGFGNSGKQTSQSSSSSSISNSNIPSAPARVRVGEPLSSNSSNVSFNKRGKATIVNVNGSNGSRIWNCTNQTFSNRGGRRSKRSRRNKRTKRRGSRKRRGSKRRR